MINKLKNKDIVVNCETEEEFNQYLSYFGLTPVLIINDDGFCYYWNDYKEKTGFSYNLLGDCPGYAALSYFKKHYNACKIVKFKDLIKETQKPPLGLKPKKIHDEHRRLEIFEAIQRYENAGKKVPVEWTNELGRFAVKQNKISDLPVTGSIEDYYRLVGGVIATGQEKPKKNKKLVLEFEKVVNNENEMVYVFMKAGGVDICCLSPSVTTEYKKELPYVSVEFGQQLIINTKDGVYERYVRGTYLTVSEKYQLIKICKAAGLKLSKINKKIRLEKKKENWKGIERVEI